MRSSPGAGPSCCGPLPCARARRRLRDLPEPTPTPPYVREHPAGKAHGIQSYTRNPDASGPTKHLMYEEVPTNNGWEITPYLLGSGGRWSRGGVEREKIRLIITSKKGAATVGRSGRRSSPGGGGGTGIQPEMAGATRGLGVDEPEHGSRHAFRAGSYRAHPTPAATMRLDRGGRGTRGAVGHRRPRSAASRRARDPLSTF